MKIQSIMALAGVSFIALSAPTFAQAADTQPAASATTDIIVQARRKNEKLQDVPKSLDVVTGADLNKLNIRQFQDVQAIAPGLNLQQAETGFTQKTTMRGISFDVNAGADATVDFYLNDASIQQGYLFRSLYDVGQIEVLKGPQGTLRGRATPSGSITVTTKAPDLYNYGGYVDGTLTGSSDMSNDIQGAVNVPIIKGVLAIRLAGEFNDNDANFVYPAHITGQDPLRSNPFSRTWSERASVRFEPTSTLQFNVTYQHMVENQLLYIQSASTCVLAGTTCPDTFFGSPVTTIYPNQRLSTYNGAQTFQEDFDIVNGRADWHVLGQKLSYVGSYAIGNLVADTPMDPGNIVPGGSGLYQATYSRNQYQSHELRLSSEQRIAGIFDYTVGIFNATTPTQNLILYNAGGYGGGSPTVVPNSGNRRETSIFGNLTAHVTNALEISGGIRKIIASGNTSNTEGFGVSSARWLPTIWTASVSYHVTPTVMVYANAGTSSRQGTTSVGPVLTGSQYGVYPPFLSPQITQFAFLKAEYSHSYELGLKSQFDNKRGLFNIDYFHQDFSNFQYANAGQIYITGPTSPGGSNITPYLVQGMGANVPVKVDGVEASLAYNFAPNFNLGADLSYVKSKITGGVTPCNSGGTNLLDSNSNPVVMVCTAGGPASFAPPFSATVHGEYNHTLNDHMTGYVRGLLSVYGATPFDSNVPYNKQSSYAILNAYFGVRAPNGAWDLSVFVKNLTNTQQVLANSAGNTQTLTSTLGGSFGEPYTTIAYTPPRQIGVNLRVNFGSR